MIKYTLKFFFLFVLRFIFTFSLLAILSLRRSLPISIIIVCRNKSTDGKFVLSDHDRMAAVLFYFVFGIGTNFLSLV